MPIYLYPLYCSSHLTRASNDGRRTGRAMWHKWDRKMHREFWWDNMRKELFGRPRFKGEDNIPKEFGYERLDWIHLATNNDKLPNCERDNQPPRSTKCEKFLDRACEPLPSQEGFRCMQRVTQRFCNLGWPASSRLWDHNTNFFLSWKTRFLTICSG